MPDFAISLEEFRRALQDILVPDLKGLRAQVEALNKRVDDLHLEIKALRQEFTGEVKALRQEFTGEVKALRQEFTGEVKALRQELGQRLVTVEKDVAYIRGQVDLLVASQAKRPGGQERSG